MQLGISSYTYTWAIGIPGQMSANPMSAFELIQKAHDLKVGILQIADNIPLDMLDQEQQMELYLFAKHLGISLEIGSRGLTFEHTLNFINLAERFRSPILRMVIDAPGFQPSIEDVIHIISELVPELTSRNIKLALENHDRLKAKEFERIIQQVGSEYVGICLDSVNSMGAGEGFETVADILLPYTINLHVKDFSISRLSHKMGFVIEGTPAGKGMLNIPELFDKLNALGNCSSAILELWTPYQSSLEETIVVEDKWARESILFLKQILDLDINQTIDLK